jgi:hypothetical protein
MIPGWFRPWCEAQGLNADRPDRWPEAAKAAFMAEKLAAFKRRWRWMLAIGQPAIIREQSGREELIRQVRRELEDALAPCPEYGPHVRVRMWSDPSRAATSRQIDPWREIPIEDVAAWVEAQPSRADLSVTTARCLMWLETTFANRTERGRGEEASRTRSRAEVRPPAQRPVPSLGAATS